MVNTIEDDDVSSLGEDHLSSMMSGIEGDQIGQLEDAKKVSIVDNLEAEVFGSDSTEFKDIREGSDGEARPTIAQDKVGSTKIANAEKTSSIFGRKGLFDSE